MSMVCRIATRGVFALWLSGVAAGADLVLESVTVKATFECAGVRVVYRGDENGNGAVAIRYRQKGSSDWRPAHPLIRIKGNRFVTSLFWLAEDTTYEIELEATDPEGAAISFPQPLEVTTRSSRFPASGRELWVDAAAPPGGDGRAEAPFDTLLRASAAAQPGDTVRIRPGVYREQLRPARSGTPDNWIRYVGEGPSVVLDGGETIPTESGWSEAGQGVYSRPYARNPRYMALDGVRLYRHSSLDNLRHRGDGIEGGFFIQSGVLYVKPPDGAPLAGRTLRAAVLAYGVYLEGLRYVEVRNLEVQYYDEMGVRLRNSHHCAVRDNIIRDSRQMIYVDREGSTDNLIEGNRIFGSGVLDWPWDICHHGHDCSSNGISLSGAGEGNVVRGNYMAGLFNGIYIGGWVTDYPEAWALENDVYDNLIEYVKDDAIEPECQAINLRIFRNHMRNLFVGISLAPIETGPTWVLYNVAHTFRPHDKGKGQWLKISLTPNGELPAGQVRVYHNSSHTSIPDHNGWSSPGFGNIHFLNNIVAATRYVFEHSGAGPMPPGNLLDFNNLYTTDAARYVRWNNLRLNPQGFAELGFQRHGIAEPPRFRDPAAGDLRLLPDDPGIDKAIYLPGINDGYCGAAPDMGAMEYCEAADPVEDAASAPRSAGRFTVRSSPKR